MTLRRRIMLYVIAVMGIISLLMAAILISDLWRRDKQLQESRARIAAGMLKETIIRHARVRQYIDPIENPAELPETLDGLAFNMISEGLIGAVMVVRNGEVVCMQPQANENLKYNLMVTFSVEESAFIYPTAAATVTRDYEIHVRSLPVGSHGYSSLAGMIAVMFLGTIILMWVIYLLLERLVIHPVERLAAASETISRTRKLVPVTVSDAGSHELHALISSFNQMIAELDELKTNLEKRVSEETAARVKAQEGLIAEQRLAATGRLAAGVAHEINNPLGGMINAANMLEERMADNSDERARLYIELITEGLERVRNIVGELLVFARPGGIDKEISIRDSFDTAGKLAEKEFREENVEYIIDVPEDLPPLWGRPNEFGQVALNLLLNGLQAVTGKNNPKITVKAESVTVDGDSRITVNISDNGCGIPRENLDKVFDLFYTTREKEGGSGLGLALARHLVSRMGGHIEVESEPGVGTTFTLVFSGRTSGR